MSGVEILGIAASVLQIADVGARLSVKLFTYSRKVKDAKTSISQLSQEIASTGATLHELGTILEDEGVADLGSRNAIATTKQLLADCWHVFDSIGETVGFQVSKASKNGSDSIGSQEVKVEIAASFSLRKRLKFPFIESDIELLKSKLESLKSSLMLMLQILSLAVQIKSVILPDQQALIQTLLVERKAQNQQFTRLMKQLERDADNDDGIGDHKNRGGPNVGRAIKVQRNDDSQLTATSTSLPGAISASPENLSINRLISDGLSFDGDDGIGISAKSTDENKLPPEIRTRTQEIEHHAMLAHNLVQEVGKTQYKIADDMRFSMRDTILETHYREWSSLAQQHHHETFVQIFRNRKPVVEYWMEKMDADKIEVDDKADDDNIAKDQRGHTTSAAAAAAITNDAPEVLALRVPVQRNSYAGYESSSVAESIWFKDAIGQCHEIPWDVACQWKTMHLHITKLFEHIGGGGGVDGDDKGDDDNGAVLKNHVMKGEYDIIGPDQEPILPALWDSTIRPDMSVTMRMWPTGQSASNSYLSKRPMELPIGYSNYPQPSMNPEPENGLPAFPGSLWPPIHPPLETIAADEIKSITGKKMGKKTSKRKPNTYDSSLSSFSSWMFGSSGGGRASARRRDGRPTRIPVHEEVEVKDDEDGGDEQKEMVPNLSDLLSDWTTLDIDEVHNAIVGPEAAGTRSSQRRQRRPHQLLFGDNEDEGDEDGNYHVRDNVNEPLGSSVHHLGEEEEEGEALAHVSLSL